MGGLLYTAGGIPLHVNEATAGSVEKWTWNNQGARGGVTNWLWFRNTGAADITLSFTQEDADAGIGITVATTAIWEGPASIGAFYTDSAGAESFEAVVFVRRG